MENNYSKLANLRRTISPGCSDSDKQIIETYWEHTESDFKFTPKWIKQNYNLSQSELTDIISNKSSLEFYVLCEECTSYEKNIVFSQSKFNAIVRSRNNNSRKNNKCEYCMELDLKKKEGEKLKKQRELVEKLYSAIENKNWKLLTYFERRVLLLSLEMDFTHLKRAIGKELGQARFIELIRALDNIEKQHLIFLYRRIGNNYIDTYQHLPELLGHKEEIKEFKEELESSLEFDEETRELKFKLIVDGKQYHPDSPKYAGKLIVKERTILEPGEYIYGQWERAHDNLYLSISPLEIVEKASESIGLSKLPEPLEKLARDFLNDLGRKLDF